jgi:hypothetical protein
VKVQMESLHRNECVCAREREREREYTFGSEEEKRKPFGGESAREHFLSSGIRWVLCRVEDM